MVIKQSLQLQAFLFCEINKKSDFLCRSLLFYAKHGNEGRSVLKERIPMRISYFSGIEQYSFPLVASRTLAVIVASEIFEMGSGMFIIRI